MSHLISSHQRWLVIGVVVISLLLGVGCATHSPNSPFADPYHEVIYQLSGSTLQIMGTPMKAGDGLFTLGPGRLVLEIDASRDEGGLVRLRELRLEQRFGRKTVSTELVLELLSPVEGRFDGVYRVIWDEEPAEFRADGSVTCNLRADFCDMGGLRRGENAIAQRWTERIGEMQFRLKPDRRFQFGMQWETRADATGVRKVLHLRGREVERKLVKPGGWFSGG